MNKSGMSALVAAGVLAGLPAWSASDVYLKLGGVEGELADGTPAEPLSVVSWSFGASKPSTARVVAPREPQTGQASGKREPAVDTGATTEATGAKRQHNPIIFRKTLDFVVAESDHPTLKVLLERCASGAPIQDATFASATERWELKEVVVTSCALSGGQRTMSLKGHITLIK
ncbi:MAG: type VI secretion system tube protein Hcp [Gammaproteobacteria bacterium]|nr:type VI secretion system tube protein Hcp [Gammaproteobacteria bacterium]